MTINDYLDLVKGALEVLPELGGIGVIVDKQQDIEEEKRSHLAKSRGYAVIIGEISNRIADKDMDGPEVRLKFGVTIYSPAIVKAGGKTGAELRDVVMRRLHHSRLQACQHCYAEAAYVDGRAFIEKENNRSLMIHATAFETDVIYPRHEDLEA